MNRKKKRHLNKILIFNSNLIFRDWIYSFRHFHFRNKFGKLPENKKKLPEKNRMEMFLRILWFHKKYFTKREWQKVQYQWFFIMNMKKFYKCILGYQCKYKYILLYKSRNMYLKAISRADARPTESDWIIWSWIRSSVDHVIIETACRGMLTEFNT